MLNQSFWKEKKVLVTGHTGFKGTWLTLWLNSLGAKVIGFSQDPPTSPNMFHITEAANDCESCLGDINHFPQLLQTIIDNQPEIIFHLAAQPLVRKSYMNPAETFKTNVLGTVHVLEAARQTKSVRVIINVTSDKCYENNDMKNRIFKENDRFGGHDPYSASKGCAEIVTESFRKSFFNENSLYDQRLASARAGNVIGGGDWAEDRLFPDIVRAFLHSKKMTIRYPKSVRPWQHVLEPLSGYILLAEKLWKDQTYSCGWNFGPIGKEMLTVDEIVKMSMDLWGKDIEINYDVNSHLHESTILLLDSSNAIQKLGWKPKLSMKSSIEWTIQWYQNYEAGMNMHEFTSNQIKKFQKLKGV